MNQEQKPGEEHHNRFTDRRGEVVYSGKSKVVPAKEKEEEAVASNKSEKSESE